MKYIIILFLSVVTIAASGQTNKPAPPKTDSLSIPSWVDSLSKLPPHIDSPFITRKQIEALYELIDERMNGKEGKKRQEALQMLTQIAFEQYQIKRKNELIEAYRKGQLKKPVKQ